MERHPGLGSLRVKGLLLAVLVFFALAPAAHASLVVTPSTTQAGAHANVTVDAAFAETPTSVALHLPPGLVGNPQRSSPLPGRQLRGRHCAPDTAVGTASASGTMVVVVLPVPVTATGTVYNLAAQPGEPARLGIDVAALGIRVRNQASIALRPDGGLDSNIAALDKGAADHAQRAQPDALQQLHDAAHVVPGGDNDDRGPAERSGVRELHADGL